MGIADGIFGSLHGVAWTFRRTPFKAGQIPLEFFPASDHKIFKFKRPDDSIDLLVFDHQTLTQPQRILAGYLLQVLTGSSIGGCNEKLRRPSTYEEITLFVQVRSPEIPLRFLVGIVLRQSGMQSSFFEVYVV